MLAFLYKNSYIIYDYKRSKSRDCFYRVFKISIGLKSYAHHPFLQTSSSSLVSEFIATGIWAMFNGMHPEMLVTKTALMSEIVGKRAFPFCFALVCTVFSESFIFAL